jgi:hypothetical protein
MKKIIAFILMIVALVNVAMPCFAFEFNQVNLYKKGDCGSLLKYFGNPLTISYIVYKHNGKEYPAYCLNSNLAGAESGSYSVETLSKLNDTLTWKVILNGYPYKTPQDLGVANEYEAFAATKQAVYWAWEERPEDKYSPVDSEAGRRTYNAFLKIINDARNDTREEPVNAVLNILPVTNVWEIDENEENRVSKIYKVVGSANSGTYTINIDGEIPSGLEVTDLSNNIKDTFSIGEEFKITIPIQNLDKNGNFTISASSKLKTYPVLYGRTYDEDKQDYAIAGLVYETQNAVLSDSYQQNNTKIVITKKEYGTFTPMQNVVFELQDENHNILFDNVKTDGNGMIVFENMTPGKYYLKELSTLEGYAPYTDLVEIDLHLFEETGITVYNTKIKENEIVKNYQQIEVVSGNEISSITINKEETQINEKTDTTNINTNLTNNIENTNNTSVELNNEVKNNLVNKVNNTLNNTNSLDNVVKYSLEAGVSGKTTNKVLPKTGM